MIARNHCRSSSRQRAVKNISSGVTIPGLSAPNATCRSVFGQEATEEKSNEITAIPKLLELLELSGCIVGIDAMGRQREISARLVRQGGAYVLGLKGSQSTMQEAVEDYFTVAHAGNFAGVSHDFFEEVDIAFRRSTHLRWSSPTSRPTASRGFLRTLRCS